VGPLASLLELKQAGRLTPEAAVEVATQSVRFLGNAHAYISAKRRRRVVSHLNNDLRPLVEELDRFQTAAPYLFSKDFERSAKEHIDSVRSLKKITALFGGLRQLQFFRQGHPHTYSQAAQAACEGGAFRGGSRGMGRG
jgi:hypothetical protein